MSSFKIRLTIGILSVGYLLISLLLISFALGWFVPLDYLESFLLDLNNRWLLGLFSLVLFIVSLTTFLGCLRNKTDKLATIHQTALGEIDLSLLAFEALVLKAVKKFPEIKEVKPSLKLINNKLLVTLKIKVSPDLDLPQIMAELQHTVKEYLEKTTGTSIQDIKIQISQIALNSRDSSAE